jgi:TetR/AcrR family transcriptional regulator, repressor for uid operon
MPRSYLPHAERRAQLLACAGALIAQHGLTAWTMPDLAKAAGLSVGALYRHFASKDALLAALIDADAEEQAQRLQARPAARKTAPNPGHPLARWAWLQLQQLQREQGFGLRLELLQMAAQGGPLGEAALRHDEALAAPLQTLLMQAAEPGSLAQREPALAQEALSALVDGLATRAAVAGRLPPGTQRLLEHLAAALCSGAKP